MNFKFLLQAISLSLLLFPTTHCYALFNDREGGDRVGNGGDVVVCPSGVELLDVYETKLRKHPLKTFLSNDPSLMAKELLDNTLKKFQPSRYKEYLKSLENFMDEAEFLPGIELKDIDDSGIVVIPKGCHLEQIAIQRSNSEMRPGDKRYVINLDLWNSLDSFNQMALILHEILFREQRELRMGKSMVVRGMVSQLIREHTDLASLFTLYIDNQIPSQPGGQYEFFGLNFKKGDLSSFQKLENSLKFIFNKYLISRIKILINEQDEFNVIERRNSENTITVSTDSGDITHINNQECKFAPAHTPIQSGYNSVVTLSFSREIFTCQDLYPFILTLKSSESTLIQTPFYEMNLTNTEKLTIDNYKVQFSGDLSGKTISSIPLSQDSTKADLSPQNFVLSKDGSLSSNFDFIVKNQVGEFFTSALIIYQQLKTYHLRFPKTAKAITIPMGGYKITGNIIRKNPDNGRNLQFSLVNNDVFQGVIDDYNVNFVLDQDLNVKYKDLWNHKLLTLPKKLDYLLSFRTDYLIFENYNFSEKFYGVKFLKDGTTQLFKK